MEPVGSGTAGLSTAGLDVVAPEYGATGYLLLEKQDCPISYGFNPRYVPVYQVLISSGIDFIRLGVTHLLWDLISAMPEAFALLPSAPNPFRSTARLRYELPDAASVSLQVYDLLGRRVRTLVNAEQAAGRYTATLDGSRLAPGTYFVRLRAGEHTQTQSVTLVR